jgi:hypothetical protein
MTSPMPLHRQQASRELRLISAQDQELSSLSQEVVQTDNKRAKRASITPIPLVARRSEQITIRSDALNHAIVDSLRSKEDYVMYEDIQIAERQVSLLKGEGSLTISIRPEEGEGWETVLEALNTLGDGCVDTYLAVMAIAIDLFGVDHLRTSIQISPDDILEVCGKKKSNGSYTPFQRAEVIKHLKTLSQTHVIATIPGQQVKRRGKKQQETVIRAEGPVIELLRFKIGEYHLITGEEIWEKRSIILGPWVTMVPGLSKNTATMLRRVLAYSGKNERYQKRLGTYLTFMFRINAKHGCKFPNDITMEALLKGAGIGTSSPHKGDLMEAIEHALDCLKRDKVIGDYWRVVDATPTGMAIKKDIQERGRGYFDAYLQQKWNFSPPPAIVAQYRALLRAASEADSGAGNLSRQVQNETH